MAPIRTTNVGAQLFLYVVVKRFYSVFKYSDVLVQIFATSKCR
jgi:hypothetical protein